jgi:hypothetical protein
VQISPLTYPRSTAESPNRSLRPQSLEKLPKGCRTAKSILQAPEPGETPEGLSNRQIDPPGPRAWGSPRRSAESPNRPLRHRYLETPPKGCRIAESTSQVPKPGDAPKAAESPNRPLRRRSQETSPESRRITESISQAPQPGEDPGGLPKRRNFSGAWRIFRRAAKSANRSLR